jgi:hypothetical protein
VRIEDSDGWHYPAVTSSETNIQRIIHPMKNLFTLLAVAATLTLTSCQTTKKDCSSCSSCSKKATAGECCGKCGKKPAAAECCGKCKS